MVDKAAYSAVYIWGNIHGSARVVENKLLTHFSHAFTLPFAQVKIASKSIVEKMPNDPDVRWKQRLQSFRRALSQLRAGVDLAGERELSNLERQGLIQAFEFTHELAWNVMKDFLAAHGSTTPIYGSKDATRDAFAAELLDEGDLWMLMIADRNRTSHTYNEDTADQIAGRIVESYMRCMSRFEEVMAAKERES